MILNRPGITIRRPPDFAPIPAELYDRAIPALFERSVAQHPQAVAVSSNGRQVSYLELNQRVNALAGLILAGRGPGSEPVALLLGHGIGAITGLLAVLKSGRPYVALDTSFPASRIREICAHAGAILLVTDRAGSDLARAALADLPGLPLLNLEQSGPFEGAQDPSIQIDPDHPSAIMYTSGSTGKPKGIVYSHRQTVLTYALEINEWFVSPSDRISLINSISFGASREMIYTALLSGARICMYDARAEGPTDRLEDWLASEQITILRLPASLLQTVFARLPKGLAYPDVRLVGLGGQPITGQDLELLRAHTPAHAVFMNLYYSTECGAVARFYMDHQTALEGDVVPVGYAWPDKEVLILNQDGAPAAPGERGEIQVSSSNMADGYFKQPELTAQKFRQDPHNPARRIYRTGDHGRFNSKGAIVLLGREDSLIKIRGFRVEIAEVEAALRRHPDVQTAVVMARESHGPGGKRLAAYVVPMAGKSLTSRALRQHAASQLPDFMIPSAFSFLPALPLLPNGKIDRQALPDLPDRPELDPADLPTDVLEQRLVQVWSDILKLKRLGVHDNFFEIGGDSLSLLSMSIEVERAFSVVFPRAFFQEPTVDHLAHLLRDQTDEEAAARAFRLEGSHVASLRKLGIGPTRLRRIFVSGRRRAREIRKSLGLAPVFEQLLAQFTLRKNLQATQRIVSRLAESRLGPGLIYRKQAQLFRRFLASLELPLEQAPARFRRNLHGDLLFRLIEGRPPFHRSALRHSLQEMPLEQLEASFPVDGLNYLEEACRLSRGVILISFHGTPVNRLAFHHLARRLDLPPIETIAHNRAHKHSGLWGWELGSRLPAGIVGSMYAEIALYGQGLLQHGGVIHISADIGKGPGRTFHIRVGDRRYVLKPGFAELALNTGAAVLPVRGRFLDDQRLLTELLPSLEPGSGDREQQLESLVRQYAAFMDASIRTRPESLSWKKIGNHLRLPRSSE